MKEVIRVTDNLNRLFPGHRSDELAVEWDAVKTRLPPGSVVRGHVVARYPFGVFLNIGEKFPALLEVIRFRYARSRRFDFEDYPAIGAILTARVVAWSCNYRQIGLSQLHREEAFGEFLPVVP